MQNVAVRPEQQNFPAFFFLEMKTVREFFVDSKRKRWKLSVSKRLLERAYVCEGKRRNTFALLLFDVQWDLAMYINLP